MRLKGFGPEFLRLICRDNCRLTIDEFIPPKKLSIITSRFSCANNLQLFIQIDIIRFIPNLLSKQRQNDDIFEKIYRFTPI